MSGLVQDFNFAAKLQGQSEPFSTQMYLPMPTHSATTADFFHPLVRHIEKLGVKVHTGVLTEAIEGGGGELSPSGPDGLESAGQLHALTVPTRRFASALLRCKACSPAKQQGAK